MLGNILLLLLLLRNAWVTEDAFITFRSVEQFFQGNGPRWNPHARTQAFTHPLWFMLLSLGRVFSSSLFQVAIFLGISLSLISYLLVCCAKNFHPSVVLFAGLAFTSSRAWIDYGTSGLENSLGYVCVALASLLALQLRSPNSYLRLFLAISFVVLVRHDTGLLFLPLVLYCLWESMQQRSLAATVYDLLIGFAPFLLWSCFSLLYYGFPFPNTAYAKLYLDLPRSFFIERGVLYLADSFARDPVTLILILMGTTLAFFRGKPPARLLAAGILLQVLYIVYVGADYMSGRFLTPAFMLAIVILTQIARPKILNLLSAILLMSFLWEGHIARCTHSRQVQIAPDVTDEKAFYWQRLSLAACKTNSECKGLATAPAKPDPLLARQKVINRGNAGLNGYALGTQTILIDAVGLVDPFLARMPLKRPEPRIGHYVRKIPKGYLRTLRSGKNHLVDQGLAAYYERLHLITSGPLFSGERVKTILLFNLGMYEHLLENFHSEQAAVLREKQAQPEA